MPINISQLRKNIHFTNILNSSVINILISLCGLFTGILNAKYLGLVGRGELGQLVTFLTLISSIVFLSLNEMAYIEKKLIKNCSSYIALTGMLSVISCVSYTVYFYFFLGFVTNYLFEAYAFIFLNLFNMLFVSFQLNYKGVRAFNFARSTPHLLNLAGYLILMYEDMFSVINAFYVLIISNLFTLMVVSYPMLRFFDSKKIQFLMCFIILKKCMDIHKVNVFTILSQHLDKILILSLLPLVDSGAYFAALTIANALILGTFMTAGTIIMPLISKGSNSEHDFQIMLTSSVLLSIIPIILLIFKGEYIIQLLLGDEFVSYYSVFIVLAFSSLFLGVKGLIVKVLRAKNKNTLGLKIEFISNAILLGFVSGYSYLLWFGHALLSYSIVILLASIIGSLIAFIIYRGNR